MQQKETKTHYKKIKAQKRYGLNIESSKKLLANDSKIGTMSQELHHRNCQASPLTVPHLSFCYFKCCLEFIPNHIFFVIRETIVVAEYHHPWGISMWCPMRWIWLGRGKNTLENSGCKVAMPGCGLHMGSDILSWHFYIYHQFQFLPLWNDPYQSHKDHSYPWIKEISVVLSPLPCQCPWLAMWPQRFLATWYEYLLVRIPVYQAPLLYSQDWWSWACSKFPFVNVPVFCSLDKLNEVHTNSLEGDLN